MEPSLKIREGRYSRRSIKRTYELPDGSWIAVLFPKFVTELTAVAQAHKTYDVEELIRILKDVCVAEGISPDWRRLTQSEQWKHQRELIREAKKLREDDARRKLEEERQGRPSFAERVAATRDKLGDF